MGQHVQPQLNTAAYNTDRRRQQAIVGSFPRARHLDNPEDFLYWWDDFHFIPSLTSATGAVNRYPYMSYIDTSDTITTLATEKSRGVLRLTTAGTDNNAPVITMQGNDGNHVMFDDNTAADRRNLWFDSRWRKDSVADNICAMFVGFVEEARAVNNGLMTDDSAVLITTIDGIGYRVLQDNGEELDFTWQTASQTNQEKANLVTTTNSAATGLVASTWIKTGFRYDVDAEVAKRIKLFINNKEDAGYITATNMAAATFPDGEELVFAAGSKNGAGTAALFDLDWIWFAQEMLAT